jgi:hypothetical protein
MFHLNMTIAREYEEDHRELGLRTGLPEIRIGYISNTIPQVHPLAENYITSAVKCSHDKSVVLELTPCVFTRDS